MVLSLNASFNRYDKAYQGVPQNRMSDSLQISKKNGIETIRQPSGMHPNKRQETELSKFSKFSAPTIAFLAFDWLKNSDYEPIVGVLRHMENSAPSLKIFFVKLWK